MKKFPRVFKTGIWSTIFMLTFWSIGFAGLIPIKSALATDSTAPVVHNAEYWSPFSFGIFFNEPLNETSATTISKYTVSGGINVTDATLVSPDMVRISVDAALTSGVSTVTVGSVTDIAGNANTDDEAKVIATPVMISISEISGQFNTADDEFIELFNKSGSTVDISGWTIDYSEASTLSWQTLATVPASTTIAANSFYLVGTYGITPTVDLLLGSTGNININGGHIRITNGSLEIDKIGWGGATNPEGTAKDSHNVGRSLERKPYGNATAATMAPGGVDAATGHGWDSENNSFDFVTQTVPSPQNTSSAAESPSGGGGDGLMIGHMPISSAPTGSDFMITAQIGDPATPQSEITTQLLYMIGDGSPSNNIEGDYTVLPGIAQSNGYFQFTVPQVTVDASTSNGLYYILKAVAGETTRYMSASAAADTAGVAATIMQNPLITNVAGAGTAYAVTGRAIDSQSDGISGVSVMMQGTGYSATTNATGYYTINVPNGMYNIVLNKVEYYEEWINDVFVNGAAIDFGNKTMTQGTGGGATGDTSKPMVVFTGPPDGMVGTPPNDENFLVFVGLSKDIDSSTLTSASAYFTIDGTTHVQSTQIIYDNDSSDNMASGYPSDPYLAIIAPPTGGFAINTTYYLVLTGAIRDTVGNALQGNRQEGGHVISFSTGGDFSAQTDWDNFGTGAMMPPFVQGVKPANGALGVAPNTKINVTFSEVMNISSVTTAGNVKLYSLSIVNNVEQRTAVPMLVTMDITQKIGIVTPTSNLAAGKYMVVITGAPQSASGIWMGDPGQSQNTSSYDFYTSNFEIGANTVADATAPTVLGSWPAASETGVAVNPGTMNIQFSENLDPATVNGTNVTLKRGTSSVTSLVNYDGMAQSISITPGVVLAPSTVYTLTVVGGSTGVTDMAENALATSFVITFTTGASGDSSAPSIMYANGDEFALAITFSEPMKAVKITDTTNWGSSVLNPTNYIIKWGDPGSVVASGTVIDLTSGSARFSYDGMSNTVTVENLGLDASLITGKDFYINMTPATVTGTGVADLSGNLLATGTTFQMPIMSSQDTKGMLGPMTGGMGGSFGPAMGNMGMMMAGAFPMNAMAGKTTVYFVDVPTTKAIPIGGKIVLTFPAGFNVASSAEDPYSPMNNDINGWNSGTVEINTVTGVQASRTVTIITKTAATQTNDFLHMDISGIVNSSIPRGFETSGYTADIKTMDANGVLLESVSTMPFFINAGGTNTLTVTVNGVTSGHNGTVKVFLGSPMTGPMEETATFSSSTSDVVTYTNLPNGDYMLFTEPTVTLGSTDYAGLPMPEHFSVSADTNKTLTLLAEASGAGKATITVNITGVFGTDDIDVFAGSPSGFKVKTLTSAGTNPGPVTFYLPDGFWSVGLGPAMPKGMMSGPPPMPDWMPPMSVDVIVSGNGTSIKENSGTANNGTIALAIANATMQIIGYVKDGSGTAIANAEVWASQSMGVGMGAYGKTDTAGMFTLKVATAGNYTVGTFKPGLPSVPEKSVIVSANTGAVDGNATANVEYNGTLITAANTLLFKIKKSAYTISGKVTDGTNPVSSVPVWAEETTGAGNSGTMTDSSGNYILYVNNGNWRVQSHIPGYGDLEPQVVTVASADVTQNLAPDTSTTYYTISGIVGVDTNGTYSNVETPLSFMPIRAVKFNVQGVHQGKDYGSMTDSNGAYSIRVPAGIYRVDIWTPNYGELGINNQDSDNTLNESGIDDDYANNPANVNATAGSVTNADIIIINAGLRTITLSVANAVANQEGFINIEGMSFPNGDANPPEPNGFFRSMHISNLASPETIILQDGDYFFNLDVPGMGHYIPDASPAANGRDSVKDDIVVSASRTVAFTLPTAGAISTVAGTVYEGSIAPGNELGDAWVWIGSPTGFHTGTVSASNGTFSIDIPSGSTYKMGIDKPGYISPQPSDLDATSDVPGNDLLLIKTDQTISGVIYNDVNGSGSYDSGEEVANGFVRAETTDGTKSARGPVDGSGSYELGVGDGTWKIWGMAPGYIETRRANVTVSGSSMPDTDIALTIDSAWTNSNMMKPFTPASGGSMDDTGADGTGVKLTAGPNALNNGSSAGNLKFEQSRVPKTNSATPIASKGIDITFFDNSQKAVTQLNDYVDLEMVLYKADIETSIADNSLSYTKLKAISISYFDTTTNDWVSLPTTTKAYFKGASDTEWQLYNGTFSAFVDTLPGSYTDYKIVLVTKVNHFTIFGTVTPTDGDAPATPTGLTLVEARNGNVDLSWSANVEADMLEYTLYRGITSGFTCNDASQINASQVTGITFTDTDMINGTSYTNFYKVAAVDDSGNTSTCTSAIEADYTYVPTAGGGSPFRFIDPPSSGVTPTTTPSTSTDTTSSDDSTTGDQAVDSAEPSEESATPAPKVIKPVLTPEQIKETAQKKTIEFAQKIKDITTEASVVFKSKVEDLLVKVGMKRDLALEAGSVGKYIRPLLKDIKAFKVESLDALNNFVTYGTPTTKKLGSGERAGVVNSYKSAFGKLPQSESEWSDAIKIGNGRWPTERNENAEIKAIVSFKKIYLRNPDRKNPNDDAAVTVMSYGLRPGNRNLDSEKAAIKSFKHIYKYNPKSATDWDIVRAIAYSGATR